MTNIYHNILNYLICFHKYVIYITSTMYYINNVLRQQCITSIMYYVNNVLLVFISTGVCTFDHVTIHYIVSK